MKKKKIKTIEDLAIVIKSGFEKVDKQFKDSAILVQEEFFNINH